MHSKKRSKMAAAFSLPYCPRMCSGDWPLIKRVAKVRHLSVTTVTPKKEFSELYDLKSKEYITDKSITNKIKITQNQKLLRCRDLGRQWARSQGTLVYAWDQSYSPQIKGFSIHCALCQKSSDVVEPTMHDRKMKSWGEKSYFRSPEANRESSASSPPHLKALRDPPSTEPSFHILSLPHHESLVQSCKPCLLCWW